MKNILNITNGDSAMHVMSEANIPGDYLIWRDILHEGPVPMTSSLEELSDIRANFLVSKSWGEAETIKQHFSERDEILRNCVNYQKIILWFEHDLYDQLQLIQILDWFFHNGSQHYKLSIICTDDYLGPMSPEQMSELLNLEKPVTESQLTLANTAWLAFRHTSPEKWQQLLTLDISALPFLKGAIIRLLEEYPSCLNGLSRTAQKALQIINNGTSKPGHIFGEYQESEERRFMGDCCFWDILHELLNSTPPLLVLSKGNELTLPTTHEQELAITKAGQKVLTGEKSFLDITRINRWIGGVRLTPENEWCWDGDTRSIHNKHFSNGLNEHS